MLEWGGVSKREVDSYRSPYPPTDDQEQKRLGQSPEKGKLHPRFGPYRWNKPHFRAGDRLLIPCIVSDSAITLTSAFEAHRWEFYTEKMLPGSKSARTLP